MALKVVFFLALITMAFAKPSSYFESEEKSRKSHEDRSYEEKSYEDRSYEFKYQVEDESEELHFGHKEEKSDGKVEGYYYVLLPDSRVQHVKYYVDGDSGYVAKVSYEGSAEYESKEKEKSYERY